MKDSEGGTAKELGVTIRVKGKYKKREKERLIQVLRGIKERKEG